MTEGLKSSLPGYLEERLEDWLSRQGMAGLSGAPWARACQDRSFGHFQTNVAMVAAKQAKKNPRELASALAEEFRSDPRLLSVDVAGPGFINFRFTAKALAEVLAPLSAGRTPLLEKTGNPRRLVLDFSAPNVAKEMHVGHIRSTILGDALARMLRAKGHEVITDNHIGDWGTQFGKILHGYKQKGCPPLDPLHAVAEMERMYQETHKASQQDPAIEEKAREELKKLQEGDAENLAYWKTFRDLSQQAFDSVYVRLGVVFDHTLGESFYNPSLKAVVQELLDLGVARRSEGAVVVFFDDVPALKDHPFLIEKSDGAALYATTDLATLRYRKETFKPDTVLYVTDGRQQLHFQQLFATAEKWGIGLHLEHVWFGAILGQDRKPLKTRDGAQVKLRELLDEAEERARAILKEKRPDLAGDQAEHMARVIGLGALKYADLSQNRNLDYVFDWAKLLAFDGNTAPYLLNAYVRTRGILRKAGPAALPAEALELSLEQEQELALLILDFNNALDLAIRENRPHHLCAYLYELASQFHRFFEHCPVLKAETEKQKQSRLALTRLTGDTLKAGLALLGIETLEEM